MSPMGGALGVTEWPLALAFLAALWSLNWMVAVLASALMLTRETSPNLEKCFVKTVCFNKMLGTFSQMIDLMLMSSSLDVKRSKCLTPPRNRTEIMINFCHLIENTRVPVIDLVVIWLKSAVVEDSPL